MANPDVNVNSGGECVCVGCTEIRNSMQKLEEEAYALRTEKEFLSLEVSEKTKYILLLQEKLETISRISENADPRSSTK